MAFGGPRRRVGLGQYGAHDVSADVGPLHGYTSPEYAATPSGASSSTARNAAPGASSLPTCVVLCVRGVFEAQRTPEARQFAIVNVHHKSSMDEDGGDEGVNWWSRTCNADREAIVLLGSRAADSLLHYAESNPPPKK